MFEITTHRSAQVSMGTATMPARRVELVEDTERTDERRWAVINVAGSQVSVGARFAQPYGTRAIREVAQWTTQRMAEAAFRKRVR